MLFLVVAGHCMYVLLDGILRVQFSCVVFRVAWGSCPTNSRYWDTRWF